MQKPKWVRFHLQHTDHVIPRMRNPEIGLNHWHTAKNAVTNLPDIARISKITKPIEMKIQDNDQNVFFDAIHYDVTTN